MTTLEPPPRARDDSPVRMIVSPGDAGWADWIRAVVAGAPVAKRTLDGTVVVVISTGALMDAVWRSALSHTDDVRLVPFVLDDIDADAVPERLASLHWVRWTDAETSARDLVAAIGFEDDLHAEIQELTERANAWLASGRSRGQLVADPTRAKQLEGLLAASSGAVPFGIEPHVREYVEHSVEQSNRKRRRRRARRWIGIIVAVSSISTSIGLFATAIGLRRTNQASGQAATALGAQRDLPAWSALSLASVVIEGTPTQQAAAQNRLATLIGSRWRGPVLVTPERAVDAIEPDIGDGLMLALLRNRTGTTEVTVVRRDTAQPVAVLESDEVFVSIDVTADEIAAAGPGGVVVFDPEPRQVFDEPARDVWMANAESVGVLTETEIVFIEDGEVTLRHPYGVDDVVSHRAVLDGSVAAVVDDGGGTYRLLVGHVEQPVTIPVEPGFRPVAAIDPSSGVVYVGGPDQQVWRWDGSEPVPTGIPLADSASFMYITDAGSLVTYSSAYGVQIRDLRSGLVLGEACRTIPTLSYVFVDQAGTYLSCISAYMNETWAMPSPPSATPIGEAADDVVEVEALDLDDALGWRPEFAAISRDGESLLVAGEQGRVALFDVDRSTAEPAHILAMATSIPDPSGVVGASFGEGIGVETDAGWWPILDCRGCSDPSTLVARTSERLQGCWSGLQLRAINDESRRRLGVVECPG